MDDQSHEISALAVLADPVRARLYRFVRLADQPVTRDEAAAEAGISRKLAAFHLDKLLASGLLTADSAPRAGRPRLPGRAPKRYRPSPTEYAVSIPPRSYDFIGEILCEAVETSGSNAAIEAATRKGMAQGQAMRRVRALGRIGPERTFTLTAEALESLGFEPSKRPDALTLRNCPFRDLAEQHRDLVCGLNLAYVQGLLAGLGSTSVTAVLHPQPDHCCVEIRPTRRPTP